MIKEYSAFTEPIEDGLIRILLEVHSIKCKVLNDAPDFVDVLEDTPTLQIASEKESPQFAKIFERKYPLKLDKEKSTEETLVWKLDQNGIWLDLPMEDVKDLWLAEFRFYVVSAKPRYLTYVLEDVVHYVKWLQKNKDTGAIYALSEFKKKFIPPALNAKDSFNGTEILKCADMIGRAVAKIDIRTRSAMIKLNDDQGRLEPLLIGMAEKLGYKISPLDKDTIRERLEKGQSVSHSIALQNI